MASFFKNLGMTPEEAQPLDTPFKSAEEVASTFSDLLPGATSQDPDELVKSLFTLSSPLSDPIHHSDIGPSSLHPPLSGNDEIDLMLQVTEKQKCETAQPQIEQLKLSEQLYKDCEQSELAAEELSKFQRKGIDDKIPKTKEQRDKQVKKLLHSEMSDQDVKVTQTSLIKKISEAKRELDEALTKVNSWIASFPPLDNSMQGASLGVGLPIRIKSPFPTNHPILGGRINISGKPAPLRTSDRLADYSPLTARSHSEMSARRRQWPPPKPTQPSSHLYTNDASPSAAGGRSFPNVVTGAIRQELRTWPPSNPGKDDKDSVNSMSLFSKSPNTSMPHPLNHEPSTNATEISPAVAALFKQATGKTASTREVPQDNHLLSERCGDPPRRRPCRTRVTKEETIDTANQKETDVIVRIPTRTRNTARKEELFASRLQGHQNPQKYQKTAKNGYSFTSTQPYASPLQYKYLHQHGSTSMVPSPFISTYEPPYTTPYTLPLGLAYEPGYLFAGRPNYYQRWLTKRLGNEEWQDFNAEVEAARIYRQKRRNGVDASLEKFALSPTRQTFSAKEKKLEIKDWKSDAIDNSPPTRLRKVAILGDELQKRIDSEVNSFASRDDAISTKDITKTTAHPDIKQQIPCVEQKMSDAIMVECANDPTWRIGLPYVLVTSRGRNKQCAAAAAAAAAAPTKSAMHANAYIPFRHRRRAQVEWEGRDIRLCDLERERFAQLSHPTLNKRLGHEEGAVSLKAVFEPSKKNEAAGYKEKTASVARSLQSNLKRAADNVYSGDRFFAEKNAVKHRKIAVDKEIPKHDSFTPMDQDRINAYLDDLECPNAMPTRPPSRAGVRKKHIRIPVLREFDDQPPCSEPVPKQSAYFGIPAFDREVASYPDVQSKPAEHSTKLQTPASGFDIRPGAYAADFDEMIFDIAENQQLEDLLSAIDASGDVENDEEISEIEDICSSVIEISDNRNHIGYGALGRDSGSVVDCVSEEFCEEESDEEWVGVQTPTESEDGEDWYPV